MSVLDNAQGKHSTQSSMEKKKDDASALRKDNLLWIFHILVPKEKSFYNLELQN